MGSIYTPKRTLTLKWYAIESKGGRKSLWVNKRVEGRDEQSREMFAEQERL